jgi:hypothetical protein
MQRSIALMFGGPDVVQTVPTDAAGEVCMKLSRGQLAGLRTDVQALLLLRL